MVIEASQCLKLPVIDQDGNELGAVDFLVFHGQDARVVGIQVVKNGVIKHFYGLYYEDIRRFSRRHLLVPGEASLQKKLHDLDEVYKAYGRVMGVTAVTESGKKIGRVADVMIEAESGFIMRFVIRNLFYERIIPRQFLVSISPRDIVFQDVVDQPVFDRVASGMPAIEPTLT